MLSIGALPRAFKHISISVASMSSSSADEMSATPFRAARSQRGMFLMAVRVMY